MMLESCSHDMRHWLQLKDFHLSDDEKEIGTYAGWISKLFTKKRGKGAHHRASVMWQGKESIWVEAGWWCIDWSGVIWLFYILIAAASIFFLAQFCTAMLWGKFSDRHGRRPVLLTGLIGNSISACSFGLSKNLWWAIGTRAFCGIVNGTCNIPRIKRWVGKWTSSACRCM